MLTLISVFVLIIGFMVFVVLLSIKLRKRGGSLFFVYTGATDEFNTKEKSKAMEMIVESNAGKKMEEQSSSEPANNGL